MVIFTAKLNKKRLFAVAAVIVIAAAAFLLSRPHGQPYDADDVLGSSSAEVGGIKTNEDRLAYISSLGYSVAAEPLSENAVFAYVQETADQIARYLGLSLKIREIRRMPGLTAFAADDL